MNDYNILVVGAGPAGMNLAKNIRGYGVLLIDRCEEVQGKPCGGLLSSGSNDYFRERDITIPEKVFSKPENLIHKFWDVDNGVIRTGRELGTSNGKASIIGYSND